MADWTPQSRVEEILFATINGEPYDGLPQSRIEELLLELKAAIEAGGGGGGTTNYNLLSNLPQVNGVTLKGNNTAADLNLVLAEVGKGLSTNDYSNEEKEKVTNLIASIQSILDGSDIDSFGDVEIALLDKADISDLGTAAAKDSTNAVISGSTDLVESGAVKDAIDSAVSSAYHHAGTKTVAQLTHDLLVAANEGNVYNITDSGTTTSDFIEGIGKTIDEGSNVGICKVGNVYMFDLLSGFVDTTNFVQKSQTSGLLNNDGTVDNEIKDDVDQLKSGLTNLDNEVNGDATTYPYADVITIEDAVPANLANCSVKIEPVQDLHGYDKPWVGGAGKNKLITHDLATLKSLNTGGTWSDNKYTFHGVTYTVITDNDGNVTGININGTATDGLSDFYFTTTTRKTLDNYGLVVGNSYIFTNGLASDVSGAIIMFNGTATNIEASASGRTFIVNSTDMYSINIRVYNNITVNNILFKPMIRLSTETDATFAPYTNICPISGHTEASVQRDGVNLFNINGSYINRQGAGGTYNISGNSITVTSSTQTAAFAGFIEPLEVGETYTISYTSPNKIRTLQIDEPISVITQGYYGTDTDSGTSFVAIKPYILINFIGEIGGVTYSNTKLEKGSTATPYEPYQGKTYTILFKDSQGQTITVYGSDLDVKNGTLKVGRVTVDAGDLTYNEGSVAFYSSDITDFKRSGSIGNQYATYCISSAFEYHGNSDYEQDANGFSLYYNPSVPGCRLAFNKTTFDGYTTTQFKQWLTDNNVQICYELATPTTIQLTPQQIQLLQGTNTISASTGQISVTVNGVSGAIGSLTSDKQDKTDYALETTEKTVVGAINEIKDSLATVVPTPASDVTITKGGYVKIGDLVLVDFYFTVSGTHAANTRIAILPSTAVNNASLPIYNITDETTLSGGRMYETGLFAGDALVADKTYNARGLYVKA